MHDILSVISLHFQYDVNFWKLGVKEKKSHTGRGLKVEWVVKIQRTFLPDLVLLINSFEI